MDSSKLLQDGQLYEALSQLKEEVRQSPTDVEIRAKLFALNCVLGHWDKARNDLGTIKVLDESWVNPAQVYQKLISAESVRADVFAGKLNPQLIGEPASWLAQGIFALALDAKGGTTEASDTRSKVQQAAPKPSCIVDGHLYPWLSDVDPRVGPVLEAYLDGQYYWIAFDQLHRIEITPPEFLVEVVWVPAKIKTLGGVDLVTHLPARYPGTQESHDGGVCLGQKTVWVDGPGGTTLPLGQKLMKSEGTDFGLLSCRMIEFQPHE